MSDDDLAGILAMTTQWVRSHAREIPGLKRLGSLRARIVVDERIYGDDFDDVKTEAGVREVCAVSCFKSAALFCANKMRSTQRSPISGWSHSMRLLVCVDQLLSRTQQADLTATALTPSLHTQRRVIGIAMRPRCEEGAWVRRIERCMARKPRREVGVGDKELAEGYRIRLTGLDDPIRLCQRVFLICDVYAAELFLELWAQSVGSEILARQQEAEPAPAELTRHITECCRWV